MASLGSTGKLALLVVDVQNGVVASAYDAKNRIANMAKVLAKAREKSVPVIFVQHSDEELKRGSAEWGIVPELKVQEGDHRIEKSHNSSFEDTGLDEVLGGLDVSELVLMGAATNWCIRATAYAALDRGYDLTLVSDAHTTESIELGKDRVIQAGDIIDELNIAMAYLDYPGRKNRAIKADELKFEST